MFSRSVAMSFCSLRVCLSASSLYRCQHLRNPHKCTEDREKNLPLALEFHTTDLRSTHPLHNLTHLAFGFS